MARPKPRHAVHTPLGRRFADAAHSFVAPVRSLARPSGPVLRIAVPALAVAALGSGIAFSTPQQAVTEAVPATSTPFERATQESVSRSTGRPALASSAAADATVSKAKAAAAKAAKEKAAKEKAAKEKAAKAKDEAADRAAEQKAAEKKAAEEKAAAAKKAAEPKKTEKAGTRYAEVTLNLRSAPKDSARTGTDVATGGKVSFTGYTSTSWAQVKVDGREGWVKASRLTRDKPKSKDASTSSGGSAGIAGGPCPSGSSVEDGLTSDAIKVHRAICHAFPGVKSFGGVRADALPEHPSGRALDAMISSSSQGQAIADYVRAHASELGVSQVIFAQRIWTVQRGSEGWRSMSDRGSATANHYDHVHVTVYGSSAK